MLVSNNFIDIEKLILKKDSFQHDLQLIFNIKHLEIYQTIYSPLLHLEMIIMDYQEVDSLLNFCGNEILEVSFKIPDTDLIFEQEFELYSIPEKEKNNTSQVNQLITMRFFEKDWKKFQFEKISKNYKNLSGSSIIEQHLQNNNIFTDTFKGYTESEGNFNITTPYWTTNTFFKYLQRQLISKEGGGYFQKLNKGLQCPKDCGYLFFRNSEGHYFLTISDMMTQNIDENMQLFFAIDKYTKDFSTTYNIDSILTYKITTNTNLFKNYVNSTFNAKINYFDITTGNLEKNEFQLKNYFNTTMSLGSYSTFDKNEIENPTNNYNTNNIYNTQNFYDNTDTKTCNLNEFIWQQKLNLLQNQKIEFTTPLNFKLQAGKLINISKKNDDKTNINQNISGNYLITDVKYIFSDNSIYTSVIACKDSYNDMENKSFSISNNKNIN